MHCGQPLAEGANFCAECGAPSGPTRPSSTTTSPTANVPSSAPTPRPAGVLATPTASKTLLHFGTLAGPVADAESPATRSNPALSRTMIGMASPPTGAPRGPAPQPAVQNPARQTMLGVAVPGIAPLRAGETPSPAYPRARDDAPASVAAPSGSARTLSPASAAGPPDPLGDIPTPIPPRLARKRGVPITAVALLTASFVLVGGLTTAWLWRGSPPIAAEARSSPDGRDIISLHCDPSSCRDGTTVEAGGTKGTFAAGEVELVLADSLHVGTNRLSLRVDRPGLGRDEVLSLLVPVAYRVRADVSAMNGPRPSIVIHVDAAPGSEVTLDGKNLTLDPSGAGAYAVDESSATEGPADESRVVAVDVGYRVTASGREAGRGTVGARVAVAPLHVDVPGSHAVVSRDVIVIAGRAAKGASVSVDGNAVDVNADGLFETSVTIHSLGERILEVRTLTPVLVARTVHVAVKRVANLASEARDFERQNLIGYDLAVTNSADSVGRPVVVEGDVIESRTFGHRTVALVDDRRGCARGPCLARVVIRQDVAIVPGKTVRAYGHFAHPYTTSPGQTVPEVEADFISSGK